MYLRRLRAATLIPLTASLSTMATKAPWKAIAERKQAERQSRIPSAWLLKTPPSTSTLDVRYVPQASGILTSDELYITEKYDATSLAEAIRSRAHTAEEVAIAFCKRAAIAQQVCNCLTEIFFEDAIERAKFLDKEFERTGKTLYVSGVYLASCHCCLVTFPEISLIHIEFHLADANSLATQRSIAWCSRLAERYFPCRWL